MEQLSKGMRKLMRFLKYLLIPLSLLAAWFVAGYFNPKNINDFFAEATIPTEPDAETIAELEAVIVTCEVASDFTAPTTHRLGMNLSMLSNYDAQYLRNVLMNPGIEGEVSRILVIVTQSDDKSFSDGKDLGQTDGFWKGASFEVLSGKFVGTKGKITNSLKTGADGLPQYLTEDPLPALDTGDVLAVTKISNDVTPIPCWEVTPKVVKADPLNVRPGSIGTCSGLLAPSSEQESAELNSYLGSSQGNLFKVSGPWNLSFWVKGEGKEPVVHASFSRLNDPKPFFERSFSATETWQETSFNFLPVDDDTRTILKFSLRNDKPGTKIWIDDVDLGPTQIGNLNTTWRKDVVTMLKTMNPSYIRNWQEQLGDTFLNEISESFGRKCFRIRRGGGDGVPYYGYSITELLDLCTQVGANPWIIVPPAFGEEELNNLGSFLKGHANNSKFSNVAIEFGNENWNSLFRSGGIPDPITHGAVADRAFSRISEAAGSDVLLTKVINGQYANPELTHRFMAHCKEFDMMSLADYFFTSMNAGATADENLKALFADDNKDLKETLHLLPKGKSLSICEINLGTLGGSAPPEERIPFVAGAVSGSALAKALLEKMALHVSPCNIFCLAQYETNLSDTKGKVNLWGACRDVSATQRWRPTGLAAAMLNSVLGGSLHKISPTVAPSKQLPPQAKQLTMAAFRSVDHWKAAIVSTNPDPVTVVLQFPEDGLAVPNSFDLLKYTLSYFDTNEEQEYVEIVNLPAEVNKRNVSVTVPPYGFVVLLNSKPAKPTEPTETTEPIRTLD
jgi:hypothetical protein